MQLFQLEKVAGTDERESRRHGAVAAILDGLKVGYCVFSSFTWNLGGGGKERRRTVASWIWLGLCAWMRMFRDNVKGSKWISRSVIVLIVEIYAAIPTHTGVV